MADLREAVAALGLGEVRTVLQSGNLVFDVDGVGSDELEGQIESAIQARFGLVSEAMVRSRAEWTAIMEANPFPTEAADDPAHLLLMALKAPVEAVRVEALRKAVTGREYLQGRGREIYLVYPDWIGRSKLTSAVVERALGVRATGRNWNTVHRLDASLDEMTG